MLFRPTLPAAAALAALALLLPACDTEPAQPASVEFQGVTYHAIGDADLALVGGVLRVSGVGPSGDDGVRVNAPDGAIDALDVVIQPLAFGANAQWGLTLYGNVGGVRTPLGRAWAEDLGGGRNAIRTEVAAGFGLDSLVYEYLLDGAIVARSPVIATGSPLTALATLAGTAGVGPESVHATREGGVVVIGTDYRSEGLTGGGGGGSLGCTAALIQVPFQTDPVCADFVRARPFPPATGGLIPAATSADIQGRAIGSFSIVSGAVD